MLVRTRKIGSAVVGALVAGGLLFGGEPVSAQTGQKVTLAVPAYFNDEALWTKVINTPQVGYVIGHPTTPANGKYTQEKELADRLAAAKAKGKKTLVYVTAGYDKVTWQTVADRVDSALAAYPGVDGVFLDEINYNECDKYKALATGQGTTKGVKDRNPGKLMVLNPGAPILNCYEGTADAYLNLERSDATVKDWVENVNIAGNVPFYQWMFKPENRSRIWQMIHSVTPANLNASIDAALGRNASVLFITPDALPNPYDSLPDDASWKVITDRVDAYNAGRVALPAVPVPTVATTTPPTTRKPAVKTTTKKTTKKKVVPKKR